MAFVFIPGGTAGSRLLLRLVRRSFARYLSLQLSYSNISGQICPDSPCGQASWRHGKPKLSAKLRCLCGLCVEKPNAETPRTQRLAENEPHQKLSRSMQTDGRRGTQQVSDGSQPFLALEFTHQRNGWLPFAGPC